MAIPVMNQVAPVTPDNAQELHVPDLIFQGQKAGLQGLAAFAEINDNKKKLELSFQKLAQDESLKEEQFSLKKQELDQDYELKKAMLPYAKRLSDAQANHWNSFAATGATIKQNALTQEKNVADRITMFNEDVAKSKVLEASPTMEGWKSYRDIYEKYGTQNIPAVKQQLKMFQSKYAQMAIPFDHYGGYYEEPSKDGKKAGGWKEGKQEMLTPGEVVARLQDPNHQQFMTNALEANGYLTKTEQDVPLARGGTFHSSSKTMGPQVTSWIDQSKNLDINKHVAPLSPISSVPKRIAAQMGGSSTEPSEDEIAIQWAHEHPNDAFSKKILGTE